jgi:hypothetical protein
MASTNSPYMGMSTMAGYTNGGFTMGETLGVFPPSQQNQMEIPPQQLTPPQNSPPMDANSLHVLNGIGVSIHAIGTGDGMNNDQVSSHMSLSASSATSNPNPK